jgi:hypothetical protein
VNLGACADLPTTPESGVWYRAIPIRYLATALSSAHTKGTTSRFSAGPLLSYARQFEILYFAHDHQTALFECGALYGAPHRPGSVVPNPAVAPGILNVSVSLQMICDLTDQILAQMRLGTTAQELTGDWEGYQQRSSATPVTIPTGFAPTQELGEALFQRGIEGFRALSARLPYNPTLIVFPENLRRGSQIIFSNGTSTHRIDGMK